MNTELSTYLVVCPSLSLTVPPSELCASALPRSASAAAPVPPVLLLSLESGLTDPPAPIPLCPFQELEAETPGPATSAVAAEPA